MNEPIEEVPAQGCLDIWSADLEPAAPRLPVLAAMLAGDEQERAGRFKAPRDRDRFIVGRGFLRALLARYLGVAPEAVPLRAGPQGKPEVEQGALAFNLAHAGHVASCVIGHGSSAVGIDVEAVAPMRDADGAAAVMMSPVEKSRLYALPPSDRLRRLYQTWTCKEAVLKADGTGLDRPLDGFEVLFEPGQAPRLVNLTPGSPLAARFWLRGFEPAPGFTGAVASSLPIARIRYRQWSWP